MLPVAGLTIGLIGGGVLVGLVQLALLRPVVKSNTSWILATATGWTFGLGIVALTFQATGTLFTSILATALGGLALGFAQWLVLATEDRRKSSWVVTTMAGWSLAMAFGLALVGNDAVHLVATDLADLLVTWTLGWSILAVVALVAILTLFPRPEKKESDARIRWW